jgi:hypothetical protein
MPIVIVFVTGMFVIDEFKYLDERWEEDLGRQSSEQVSFLLSTFCFLLCAIIYIASIVLVASRSWGWMYTRMGREYADLISILNGFGGIMDDA